MTGNNDELPPIEEGVLSGKRTRSSFFWQEAMPHATLKHGDAQRHLRAVGLAELGAGDTVLDSLASLLDSRNQLTEPGELLLSADSTLVPGGGSPFYFLDLRARGSKRLVDPRWPAVGAGLARTQQAWRVRVGCSSCRFRAAVITGGEKL